MAAEDDRPDVLVIGGGPAGSTVAGLLARRGWSVTVVDRARFPRQKPCGECVNPGAVDALRRLGLLDSVLDLDPAPLRGWRIRTFASREAVGTFGRGGVHGFGVPRRTLDRALLQRARERGARVEEGTKAEEVTPGGHDRDPVVRLRTATGDVETRSARIVVGADGLRSVTARSLRVHRHRPRLRKLSLTLRIRGTGPPRERGLLVLGDDEVVGLAPVHERRPLWNVTVVVRGSGRARQVTEDPAGFAMEALRAAPIRWNEGPEPVGGPWASGPFDRPVDRPTGGRIVLVGDAAGYFDPLTGQGIHRALRSAELAADAIDRTLRRPRESSEDELRTYDRTLLSEFRGGRRLQKAIEVVVSRRALREPVVSLLARAPRVLSALVRITGDVARCER